MTTVIQVQVPEGLSLVGASLLSTVVLLVYQVSVVAKARGAAKVPYPQAYAEKAQEEASLEAKKFNCAQRAHQNTLEWIASVYVTTALSAIQHPKLTAGMLAGWTLTRIMYTNGYATGDPSKRGRGSRLGFILQLGLLGTSFAVVGSGLRSYLKI
ncbi:membrane-associated proteins in eicosanoid and glutathione metabolism [Marasmius fiardii PR-910]|nr:membrane-associated proteins in eicosanoid and glutathione metabolism [Marasmius fiardii PR-910]